MAAIRHMRALTTEAVDKVLEIVMKEAISTAVEEEQATQAALAAHEAVAMHKAVVLVQAMVRRYQVRTKHHQEITSTSSVSWAASESSIDMDINSSGLDPLDAVPTRSTSDMETQTECLCFTPPQLLNAPAAAAAAAAALPIAPPVSAAAPAAAPTAAAPHEVPVLLLPLHERVQQYRATRRRLNREYFALEEWWLQQQNEEFNQQYKEALDYKNWSDDTVDRCCVSVVCVFIAILLCLFG